MKAIDMNFALSRPFRHAQYGSRIKNSQVGPL
jgi:hypothetical protein